MRFKFFHIILLKGRGGLGGRDRAQTSVISSLVRFCLGCSIIGAYIISFLKNKNEVTAKKNKFQDDCLITIQIYVLKDSLL